MYQEAARAYPDVRDWVTLSVSYVGHGLPSVLGAVDASSFDLEIMNRAGGSFLTEQGIRWPSGPYQMTVETKPVQGSFRMGLTL